VKCRHLIFWLESQRGVYCHTAKLEPNRRVTIDRVPLLVYPAKPLSCSRPPKGIVCGALYPLSPNMSTKEMHFQSFRVSQKLLVMKKLLCTWIKNVWAHTSPTVVDKMLSNIAKRLQSTIFLLQDAWLRKQST
jgi:hypothetical protein